MARRCGNSGNCAQPRANWWKAALGIDYYSSGGSTITSVVQPDAISVAYGTAWPPNDLPEQVTVNLSNGSTSLIDVEWVEGDYDGDVWGTYTIVGNLVNLHEDITNPDVITASIDVTVEMPDAEAIGLLHSDDFNSTSLASYTQNGSTMSAATGNLVLNTAAGNHSNYLLLNTPSVESDMGVHCFEKWVQQILFTAPTGNPFGFGIGVRSQNGPEQFDNAVRLAFDLAQEANRGTVYYYNAQNHSAPSQTIATMGGTFSIVSGTDYIFEVERNKNVLTARLKSADGLTTHKTYTSFTYNITSSGQRAHNVGKFCLWAYGATNLVIKSWTVTTSAYRYADLLALGDSNMHGLYAASNSRRYVEQACTALGIDCEIVAGINAEVTDVPLTCAIAMEPKQIYINIGSNDEANGVANATWQTRISNMISTLNAAGYDESNVILGIPCARNGQDMASIETYINSTYPSYRRVNLYQATKQSGNTSLQSAYNSGDNIHMSPAGNDACAPVLQVEI